MSWKKISWTWLVLRRTLAFKSPARYTLLKVVVSRMFVIMANVAISSWFSLLIVFGSVGKYELMINNFFWPISNKTGCNRQDSQLISVEHFLMCLGITIARPPFGLPVFWTSKFLYAGLARTAELEKNFERRYKLFLRRKCSWIRNIGNLSPLTL